MAFTTTNLFPPSEWPRAISRLRYTAVAAGNVQALEVKPGHAYVMKLVSSAWGGGATLINTAGGISTTPYYDTSTMVPIPGLAGGATANVEVPFVCAGECVVVDNTSGTGTVTLYIAPILSHD